MDHLDQYYMKGRKLLLFPCSYYLGEVLIRAYEGLKWTFIPGHNYIDYLWLETLTGKRIDLINEVEIYFTDPDNIPMLMEIFRILEGKL